MILAFHSLAAYNFKTISVKEGLTDNAIESIVQDSEGYMWFATNNGLNRYDGYDVSIWSLRNRGQNFDQFKYVSEDKDGNIWATSASGEVYIIDRRNDQAINGPDSVLAGLGIPYSAKREIFVDENGNLWTQAATTLYQYDYSSGHLSSWSMSSAITSLTSDETDSYLSLSDGSIVRITNGGDTELIRQAGNRGNNIMLDRKGRLWSYGYNKHPEYYNLRSDTWHTLPDNPITSGSTVTCAIVDKDGNIWFGTISQGVIVFSHDLKSYQTLRHESDNRLSIPSNHISCMYAGGDNTIWIGTAKGGAALTSTERVIIRQHDAETDEDVKTITEDSAGGIWFGLDGKGLSNISAQGTVRNFTSADGSIPGDNITGSARLNDGTILFSSFGNGVFTWDGKKAGRLHCPDKEFFSNTRFCSHVLEDRSGQIWILTFSNGVVCLQKDGRWTHFHMDNSDLVSNYMTSMTYSDTDDRIFISNRQCIYEIYPDTMKLNKLQEFHQVTNIHVDSRNLLWIGTADGLYRTRGPGKDSEIYRLTTSDGLSHNYILGICEDLRGDIWVTTNDGFTYIYIINDPLKDLVETRCFAYYDDDGIGDGRFSYNAIYCSGNGRIWMGNDGKLITADMNAINRTLKGGKLTMTSIHVSGTKSVMPESGEIRISHSDNLSLTVSAMDYLNKNKIKYEYRTGEKEEWILMPGNRLFLNSLQPGTHTLDIRTTGSTHSPEDFLSIRVKVSPPFWRSPVAIIIYILSFLFVSLVFIQMIKSRNVKIIDREIHEINEKKIQFFTSISHDLKTPLTMIITPVSKLLREHKDTPLENDLALINRSALTLMDEVEMLLDFKKMDKGKSAFNPTYGDISRFVREIVSSFDLIFDDSIKLITAIDERPVMTEFDRNKIMRIVHNLLSNAFKFNHPKGYIKVSLQKVENDIEISVADSGSGISDEAKQHIFERFYIGHSNASISGNGIGLHIVQEFVRLHNGTVSVSDNHPSGSIFTVTLPITGSMPGNQEDIIDDNESCSDTTDNKTKVLIVDDNIHFREFLKKSLSDKYKVYEASNGKSAMESLEKHSISIIISDVMMPVMDGMELCRQVRNDIRYSHIPFILLTAIQNKDTIVKGLRDGADEYISKPFDIEVLVLKIEKILKRLHENYEKFRNEKTEISEITLSRLDEELMNKIMATIDENLSDSEYSIESLSTEVGISRSGLYKKLMFITGKSPIELLRTCRLKKGRDMLESGETSVSQIAWSVGFSPKQFSKYFKEEYGCLPSEYLKHRRQQPNEES